MCICMYAELDNNEFEKLYAETQAENEKMWSVLNSMQQNLSELKDAFLQGNDLIEENNNLITQGFRDIIEMSEEKLSPDYLGDNTV